MTTGDHDGLPPDVVLQRIADMLADEREIGRQRMRDLGISEAEIDFVSAHAERMHETQLAWAESVMSQRAGLATLQ